MTPTPDIVVATWNVHRCIGRDGRHDPERIAGVIAGLGADVVALQEVDSEVTRPGFVDQLDDLARRTGYAAVAGPSIRRRYGRYGTAILTRLSVRDVHRHDLSVPGREPRGALEVTLDRGLRVIATHLGLARGERRRQVARLADLAVRASTGSPADTRVLAGDVNMWWPLDRSLRRLERAGGESRRVATFPARFPLLPLDRIWVAGRRRLASVDAVRDGTTAVASDHLPLVARLAWW